MYLAREPVNGKRPPSSAKPKTMREKNTPAIIHESTAAGPMTPTAPRAEKSQAEPTMPLMPNIKTSSRVRDFLSVGPAAGGSFTLSLSAWGAKADHRRS